MAKVSPGKAAWSATVESHPSAASARPPLKRGWSTALRPLTSPVLSKPAGDESFSSKTGSFRAKVASARLVRSKSSFFRSTRRNIVVSEEFRRQSLSIAHQLKQRDKDRVFVIDPRQSPLLSIWDGVTTLALLYTALVMNIARPYRREPRPTPRATPCPSLPWLWAGR